MKQSTAVRHLKVFMISLQKYRSNTLEALGYSPDILATIMPWVFGEKCPLPFLQKILDRTDKTGTLQPSDYYNMMTILHSFMREIIPISSMIGEPLPADPPSTNVLKGWDAE